MQSLLLLSDLFGTSVDELIEGDVKEIEETYKHDSTLMQRLAIGMIILAALGITALFAGFKELLAD